MGKRRERRMAAKSNAGRRVKLDLFAEPSGDLGASSGQDEGNLNSKHDDGLPNSPSSSGQQQENPLLLLGQYSDEETDEEPKKSRSSDTPVDSSLADHTDQVEGSTVESEETGPNLSKDTVSQVAIDSTSPDGLPKLEESDIKKVNRSASGDLCKEMEAREENHVSGTFDAQVVGDISSGWKIVMHEETSQYYYWNVDTGETSWEVPEVLAQVTNSSVDHSYSAATDMVPTSCDNRESDHNLTANIGEDGGSASLGENGYGDAHLACPTQKMDEYEPSREDVFIDEHKGSQEFPLATDNWVALIRRSETLLEKLKSSVSYEGLQCGHERILRYSAEIETRILDMKSLASYGTSLHPFWVHSNMQLERLELAVDEVFEIAKSKYSDALKKTRDEKSEESRKFEADQNRHAEVFSTIQTADISTEVDASTAQEHTAVLNDDVTVYEHFSQSQLPTRQVRGIAECGELATSAVLSDGSVLMTTDAGEDVDMDVDMEVEDVAPVGVQSSVIPAKPDVVGLSLEPSSVATEGEYFVPPPPDEEFIPPPPPDTEQIPPPPPDEPPEPSYPPSQPFTEVEQISSYSEQYPLSYPNSTYEFYGHNPVTSNEFYGHAEGCQVVIPHGSVSYGQLPSTYSNTASLVNPVEQVAYYNIQDAAVPPVPGVSTVDSSKFHTPSDSFSFSYSSLADTSSSILPQSSVSTSVISSTTKNVPPDLPSTSAPIEASATTAEKGSISAPSMSTAAAVTAPAATVATSVDSKVQSKVLRSKKRTVAVAPSLRSNKKVSSLVDKWKAAKEELQEDEEDEAKTALAMLEKKRQREIEEWRAQQIASGEAKDNANFQPLGGDWRERVKRRRAQAGSKTGQDQEQKDNENQQPDIVELSRNLPSGWQAYWDESTKQVYYGNLITAETTWTRPTK